MNHIINRLQGATHTLQNLSRTKKAIILIFFLVLISVTTVVMRNNNSPKFNVSKVGRSDIIEIIDESGTVKVSGQTDIYSPTNGIIEEIFVNNGDSVITGQELFRVVSTATEQEKQAALANYLSAKATLDTALSTKYSLQADMFGKWDAFRNLATNDTYEDSEGNPKYDNRSLPDFHISEKEWLASENRYKSQEQVIAQAQALMSSTWALYQATQTTTVKAVSNGVVANLSIFPGDNVQNPAASISALSSSTTRPTMTIVDKGNLGVVLSLGEMDIAKVSPGNEAEISIVPITNRRYAGVVHLVDEIGHDVKGVTKYDVYLGILDKDDLIKSGMSADVRIVTNKVTNVLSVPNTSIKPYKRGKAVQRVGARNELVYVPVVVGARGERMTEIVEGLTEGEEIVVTLTNEQSKRPGLFEK